MSVPQRYVLGIRQNPTKFCIRLVTNQLADTTSFSTLKNSGRTFNVYQWKNNLKGTDGNIYSGYCPWLHYGRNKWTKYERDPNPDRLTGMPMLQGHVFMSTFEQFKVWLGEGDFEGLLADLF